MRELLGGKGANLAEMNLIGIPVPPGIHHHHRSMQRILRTRTRESRGAASPRSGEGDEEHRKLTGMKFGDKEMPLLVSVRFGRTRFDAGHDGHHPQPGYERPGRGSRSKRTGNPRFAWDSYRRFVQMYGDVVLGMKPASKEEHDPFEELIDAQKEKRGVKNDTDLTTDDLKELVHNFKAAVKKQTGEDFPANPWDQLWGAICAVFGSWMNERAILYRKLNNIPAEWGTAVSVQAMVFGNMGDNSATGVAFSRDAATGENLFNGEYLINAQGEDVVAGVRTPQPISKLAEDLPECYEEFMNLAMKLENHFRDMQDMEFTIEEGKLYFLQTRNGKRTAPAAIKIACDLVDEGQITPEEAVCRIEAKSLDQLLHPTFDTAALKAGEVIGSALPASPGAAAGKVYFTADEAKAAGKGGRGERVILVRLETSPEDIEGMHASQGILTVRGGMTSHAAVVARGMGTCCVSGCGEIKIDEEAKTSS